MNECSICCRRSCLLLLFVQIVISGSKADAPGTFPSLRSVSRFWHAHRPCCSAADPSHSGCWISIRVVSAALEPFSAAEVNCSADPPGRCAFSPDASSVRDSSAWRVMDYPAEMCLHLWPSLLAERVAGPTMHWRSVGTAMSKGNTLLQYKGLWCSCRPPTDWERILIFVLFRISNTIALLQKKKRREKIKHSTFCFCSWLVQPRETIWSPLASHKRVLLVLLFVIINSSGRVLTWSRMSWVTVCPCSTSRAPPPLSISTTAKTAVRPDWARTSSQVGSAVPHPDNVTSSPDGELWVILYSC